MQVVSSSLPMITRIAKAVRRQAVRATLTAFDRLHVGPAVRGLLPANLVILVYHRIDNPDAPEFTGFRQIVSATPEQFAQQLDYLAQNFTVIGLDELEAWHSGKAELPPNAVMITFDDGYRDNLVHALPALEARRLPALLFVTTDFVDGVLWPWWDWTAEAFKASSAQRGRLPLLGERSWHDSTDRNDVICEWIDAAKSLQYTAFQQALSDLAQRLEIDLQQPPPSRLLLNWEEVAELTRRGFRIGNHTATHPILVNTDRAHAGHEISAASARLEQVAGRPVTAFAYPSGRFTQREEMLAREHGVTLGFAAEGGFSFAHEIAARPLAIRRCCIGLRDTRERFAAKAAGLTRLADR